MARNYIKFMCRTPAQRASRQLNVVDRFSSCRNSSICRYHFDPLSRKFVTSFYDSNGTRKDHYSYGRTVHQIIDHAEMRINKPRTSPAFNWKRKLKNRLQLGMANECPTEIQSNFAFSFLFLGTQAPNPNGILLLDCLI